MPTVRLTGKLTTALQRWVAQVEAETAGRTPTGKGNCWDNAPMERLFRSLKTEWMPRQGYLSLQETRQDVGEYVMEFHIRERVHNFNGYVTPEMKERHWQPPNGVPTNT